MLLDTNILRISVCNGKGMDVKRVPSLPNSNRSNEHGEAWYGILLSGRFVGGNESALNCDGSWKTSPENVPTLST